MRLVILISLIHRLPQFFIMATRSVYSMHVCTHYSVLVHSNVFKRIVIVERISQCKISMMV